MIGVKEFHQKQLKIQFIFSIPFLCLLKNFPEADVNQIFSLLMPVQEFSQKQMKIRFSIPLLVLSLYKDIILSNLANTAAKAITVNFSSL